MINIFPDSVANSNIIWDIYNAVDHAKQKHPVFARNFFHAVSLATEELGEFAKAVNDNDIEHAKKEALDTIAVLIRFIELTKEE